ncbi:Nucleotide-diphosphate-sugar epimerase [Frankia sp. AiPs1]|uniref:NAD(P)H-binding protein n=1 Tax=Frankia sp. AiPa1 TaxID=573492 RepID=UPI00202B0EC2|nr:NAD(P)H-binding protein [Frankia sp. AiPa1]MCL9758562.1 NAD(P)H-binding protein [Frankia sp. AiPa1]
MIVVTGATGNVGRQLVTALADAGEQVTALARRLPGTDLPRGVFYREADLTDPETLRPALDGAGALFLLVAGDSPHSLLDVAKAGGVRRVVLLSSQGAGTRPEVYRHPRMFEDAVGQSGLDWTVLRPGGFHSNAFAWAPTVRAQRTVAAPFGDVGLPTIDPADIAEVAAAALRDPRHTGRLYELTGPALTTPRERAQTIADVLGEPVRFVEQSRQEARAQMLQVMPPAVVEGTLTILGEPTPAEQQVSHDVEQILGRAPRTFADWARRNIAAFQ